MRGLPTIEGPLPQVLAADLGDLFGEDCWARGQYVSHRSGFASPDLKTYHIILEKDPVGFLSSLAKFEDDAEVEEVRLFLSVEYAYVTQRLRGLGLAKAALAPLLREAIDAINSESMRSRSRIRVYAGGVAMSSEGAGLVTAFQRLLARQIGGLPTVFLDCERALWATRRGLLG